MIIEAPVGTVRTASLKILNPGAPGDISGDVGKLANLFEHLGTYEGLGGVCNILNSKFIHTMVNLYS